MRGRSRWRARCPSRPEGDAGFGLLEVVIASGVMLTALTSMAYVTTNSFYDIAGAKQRQTAVALADGAIEQVRALPFDAVRDGNRSSDLAGDPRVLGAGTAASPYVMATTGEALRHESNPQSIAPLVPNVGNRTVDGVVYAVRSYVSHLGNDPNTSVFTVTVYVDWRSGGRGHLPTFVRATTVVLAPSAVLTPNGGIGGCAFATIEPFAGPCPASFGATASIAPGRIRVSGSGSVGPALADATTEVPTAEASLERGQISKVSGTGRGGGLSLGGVPLGYPTSTSQADDHPDAAIDEYKSVSATSAPISASAAAGPGTVTVSATGTPSVDTSESVSSIVAKPANPCRAPNGAMQTDGLPCHRSLGRQAGTLRAVFDLTSIALGTVQLSEVAAAPDPVVAFAKHRTSSAGSGPCGSTSRVGCVFATGNRSIGTVRGGGLPSALGVPAGYAGYLYELDNYRDSVFVEAGIAAGATNPAASSTVEGGILRHYNGGGYTTITLSSSSSFSVTTPVVTVSSLLYSVSVSSTLKRGASTTSAPAATCLGSMACVKSADALLGAPLLATTNYTIRLLGTTIYQLTVTVDLGDLHATATYVDPP